MQTLFSPNAIPYEDGTLASHFAYRNFDILGDSCVAWIGPCRVSLEGLADLEDVQRQAPIFSEKMLHFLWEGFQDDLNSAVFWQRLMVAKVFELLQGEGCLNLERRGDDLYQSEKKLSVSIATATPVSSVIHLGLNVSSQNTPVSTIGLEDLGIAAPIFAEKCLDEFRQELLSCRRARVKVRAVR